MDSQIERIFIDKAPSSGPRLSVMELGIGSTPLERYRNAVELGRLRAGRPLALIIRSTPLSSADVIKATSAEWRNRRVIVELESRRYTGAFSGNDVMIAFVQVALGPCAAGEYEALVTETQLEFTEMEHPERALGSTSSKDLLTFKVAA